MASRRNLAMEDTTGLKWAWVAGAEAASETPVYWRCFYSGSWSDWVSVWLGPGGFDLGVLGVVELGPGVWQ